MSKAKPIPDTISRGRGGLEKASCIPCGAKITRANPTSHWWHVQTGRSVCMESKDGDD